MTDERLLSTEEVADRLRVSPGTVAEWCRLKKIRAFKVGKLWRIPEDAIQEFLLEKNKPQPEDSWM